MKRHDTTWERLAAAARKSPPRAGGGEAPYGFAARVAARAFAETEADGAELWLRYGWRALAAALAAVAVCAAVGLSRPAQDWAESWVMAPLSEPQNDRSL